MPKKFTLNIEPEALTDIQNAVNYYNAIQKGLGRKFYTAVDKHFNSLKRHPKAFAIRYDEIRCTPVRKFPYMIHYKVFEDAHQVSIKAIFCTYQNPEKWASITQA